MRSSKFTTKPPQRKTTTVRKVHAVSTLAKRAPVDIVSGKELVFVYFDPEKAIDCSNSDPDWLSENKFIPACVIKEEGSNLVVKLPNEDVYKVPQSSVTKVSSQGIPTAQSTSYSLDDAG